MTVQRYTQLHLRVHSHFVVVTCLSSGCCNKVHSPGGLQTTETCRPQFGKLKVQDRGQCGQVLVGALFCVADCGSWCLEAGTLGDN